MIKVSIIIPTFNRNHLITKCVTSLISQDYPSEEYEIVIIDDGSTDSTEKQVNEIISKTKTPQIRYIKQDNQGPATARNTGWKNAFGEIIAFIDDDCVASEDWLQQITSGYDSPTIAGTSGNVQAMQSNKLIPQFLIFHQTSVEPFYDEQGKIIFPIPCNASFRKNILEEVHRFDETFPYPGGEDVDLGIRIRKLGYYFEDNRNAIVHHHHKDTFHSILTTWYYYGSGNAQWQIKHNCILISRMNSHKKVYWSLKSSVQLSPVKTFIWYIAHQILFFREIHRYTKRGVTIPRAVIYYILEFSRCNAYYLGQWVGYNHYKRIKL